MHSSKEDLIEMSEISSPTSKLPLLVLKKRNNQVHSPSFLSPVHHSSEVKDVTSIFTLKKTPRLSLDDDEDNTETISEISENLSNSGENSQVKLSDSKKKTHWKQALNKLKRESTQIESNLKTIRSKLHLNEIKEETTQFSFVNLEPNIIDDNGEFNEVSIHYCSPENMQYNFALAEKTLLTINKNRFDKTASNPLTSFSIKPQVKINTGDSTIFYLPTSFAHLQEVVVVKNNILELSLLQLNFHHHPLFSVEHVLREKIKQTFDKYSSGRVDNYLDEIKLIRENRMAGGDNVGQGRSMKKLRECLFKEGKVQRESLKDVLNIWKAIKKIRFEQRYSNTQIRLLIKRVKTDVKEDQEKYEEMLKDFVQDVLYEKKNMFRKKLKEYKRKLRAKEQEISSDDAQESDIEKPIFQFDKLKVQDELRQKFEESFRPPGEPKLFLFLKNDHPLTDSVPCDRENDRRKVILSTKFNLRILCDGILVCKSQPVSLNDDFSLDMCEMVSIQLTNIPEFLTLELYEHPKSLLKKKIADIQVKIPSISLPYIKPSQIEASFDRKEIVHYKHTGVGCGSTIKKLLEDNELFLTLKDGDNELYTKGTMNYMISWQNGRVEKVSSSDENLVTSRLVRDFVDKWGEVRKEQLHGWMESNEDPNQKAYFQTTVSDMQDEYQNMEYFRLNPHAGKFIFCKPSDIQSNIRLQYLQLRNQNEIEFDGILIPNRIKEIPFVLLKDFKKRKNTEAIDESEYDHNNLREAGQRRLNQIYSRIFYICKGLSSHLSYESVVDEKYLIYFEELIRISLKNFLNWFSWRPKLTRPLPTARKEIDHMPNSTPRSQNKIVINILSGKNLPEKRIDGESVQPFLEITHENSFTRTKIGEGEGGNPVWNERVEFALEFQHANYLNPDALSGSVVILLFDALKAERGNTETFFLGEITIPLAALTTGLQLFGWFKVSKPWALFGYESHEDLSKSPKHAPNINDTYIQLDLHIEPNIPLMEPNIADLPTNDVSYIKEHVTKWNKMFNSNFPNKKFSALAIDTEGRSNCITRYLRPLEPPQLNNEFDVTLEQCLRFVSLIPFTECNNFYKNVWLTTNQLLQFMIGSVIDHCVALTCFLLALEVDAYLVLGYGIPQGFSSYVLVCELTRESNFPDYFILDVVQNQKFHLSDPLCPLQRVHCVANGENVWGNAQRTQNIAMLRFDLNRRSDWWSLFNSDISAPTHFVNNKINFMSNGDFEYVGRHLEKKLMRKFCKWRPMQRTSFNHRVSELMKNALRFLEINAMYGKNNTETLMEIQKVTSRYSISGLITHFSFMSIHKIIKKIKNMNVHIQDDGVTEFGLSVFAQCYPGQVSSVWIFIGSLLDKM